MDGKMLARLGAVVFVAVALTAPAGTVAQYRIDGGSWKSATKSFTIAANGVHTPYASGSAATRAVHAALLQQRHIAVDFAPTRSGDYLRLVVHPRTPPEHYFALVEEVARLASVE